MPKAWCDSGTEPREFSRTFFPAKNNTAFRIYSNDLVWTTHDFGYSPYILESFRMS